MNERIRQLAEQAGIDFFNSTDPEYSGREYCEAWTEQQQKFAELIVEECMRMCEVAQVGYLTHGLEKEASGAFSVKQYIEEYLGVES